MTLPKVDAYGNLTEDESLPENESLEGSESTIQDVDKLAKLFESKIQEALKPVISEVRGLQGRQDKEKDRFDELMGEFNKAKLGGASDADAQKMARQALDAKDKESKLESTLDLIAKALQGGSFLQGATGSSSEKPADYEKVVEDYGVDPNDAEVASLIAKSKDSTSLELALGRLVAKRQATSQVDSAQRSAPLANKPLKPSDAATMAFEYKKEMMAKRGNKFAMKAIKESFREKGLDVDGINLLA